MSGCVFCAILAGKLPAAFVLEDDGIVAFMDAYPLRHGHVLVVPRKHATLMTELDGASRTALIETGCRIAAAMRAAWPDCRGINWVVNDGKAANQHVPHVHLHLIPRQGGDGLKLLATFAGRAVTMLRPPRTGRLEPQARQLREQLR
jgi:histidine triad (HIT) family protein